MTRMKISDRLFGKTNLTRKATIGCLTAGILFSAILPAAQGAPEAFEVGPEDVKHLPGGKEADGIRGDFVLRNDRVVAVISHMSDRRRANMSTFYGSSGITPGCLYDLTYRGENNDQITIFTPSGQRGPVSYVRIADEGDSGMAVVETVTTAANNNGLYKRHEYRLRDGWNGVWIVTTLRNEGKESRTVETGDRWTTVNGLGTVKGITCGDAIDPADKAGYAYAWLEQDGMKTPPSELTLGPGDERVYGRFLAVGHSPAEAFGIVAARRGPTGVVRGQIESDQGEAVSTGKVEIRMEQETLPAYPDDQGRFAFRLPPGSYVPVISDRGRDSIERRIEVRSDLETGLDATLPAAAAIAFEIRGEDDEFIPCKAQFIGINGTQTPDLGPANRAHGCVNQYHSETGQFRVPIPSGSYRIIVTRGIEFNHLEQEVTVGSGETVTVRGTLERVVETPGWVSADFHNHSTPSGDNTCGTDDRVINLAAEHIEFAPTTEHNRFYDWMPHIKKLGLEEEMYTISGIELTGGGAHLNSFPFEPHPHEQDGGAPVWKEDPRLNAITLRDYQEPNPSRWIQINHPDMVEDFIDRNSDGQVDGGFLGLGRLIDGVETQNGNSARILAGAPYRVVRNNNGDESLRYIREFIWLQLLNQGHRYWCVAVSDAHSVYGNGVGGWRCYVQSSTDEPSELDWKELSRHAKAGRLILSSGPYLEVSTADGVLPGGVARATGSIPLKVKVQCTDWIDIDRVQVLVNGRQRPDLNFTRESHPDWFQDGVVKFDRTLDVPLSQDSHLIVVAYGENFDLSTGFGTSPQSNLNPCAYNNPIFVDVDGGGFTPSGDTLGYPLPVKQMPVEEAKRMLGRK